MRSIDTKYKALTVSDRREVKLLQVWSER